MRPGERLTLETMSGLVFRKKMKIEAPERVKKWCEDITLSDETLPELAQSLVNEDIIGEFGVVDQRNSEIEDISFRTELTRLNN
jgi:hypothetical protein